MGTALLVFRLAARDVRRHVAQAALLVVAIAAATATLTMALALNGVTSQPYAATRAATKGPDVVANLTSASQAKDLSHASGVTASSGPYPVAAAAIRFDGRTAEVFAEGRDTAPAAVDQPTSTAGNWVRPGGVVLERTFADALGVSVGDRVTLNDKSFDVAGIAVTAAEAPYPNLCYLTTSICSFIINNGNSRDMGVIWMTTSDAIGLTSKANPLTLYVLNLKLDNPGAAQAFVSQHFHPSAGAGGGPGLHLSIGAPHGRSAHAGPQFTGPVFSTWEGIASADALLVEDAQSVLEPGAFLLALLAIASVAVLVGRRLSEYARRVGLLKAVGGTPNLVAAVFLIENLALALFAGMLGLVTGWLLAPILTNPGAALVGTAGAPAISLVTVLQVAGLAVAIALAATLAPAIRAARTSTIVSLNDVGRAPRRRGALIRISRRLPVPTLFAVRLVARRPRRALLSAANIAVTVMGIVAVIAFHADVDGKLGGAKYLTAGGLSDPVINRDEQMLAVVTVMLVTLAALNAIFTTWATVLDARRSSALMRALGARARQVSAGLVVAQVLSALPGAIVGIPLGIVLFKAAVHDGTPPSVLWLAATVVGTLAVMAALTVVPARFGARHPVSEILQAEAA
jgi:predicted lysophospholipase L1 biosynthesis ABC-type transport system permease subunit